MSKLRNVLVRVVFSFTKKKYIALVGLVLAGCSPAIETTVDAGSQPDAAAVADAGQTLVGACLASDPASCAYAPAKLYKEGTKIEKTLSYVDIAGLKRTLHIEIRRPKAALKLSPLIVWSHGGADGKTDPSKSGVAWGKSFNSAGFIAIAIAHPPRGAESARALCVALKLGDCDLVSCDSKKTKVCTRGAAPNEEIGVCEPDPTLGASYCRSFKTLNWDRPPDLRKVLDWVEAEASGGILDGVVDTSRIAYAGHSAGAGSTMMVAGAARRFRATAEDHVAIDTRPVAFMSCSPQGPDDSGFTTASFTRKRCEELATPEDRAGCLTRPHLVLTSRGDGGDTAGENRRLSFDLAPAGDRYLGYITELASQHTTFDLATEGCEGYAKDNKLGPEFPARCHTYRVWIRSAALAFFDATLRDDAKAKAYLASGNMSVLSGGALEWTLK